MKKETVYDYFWDEIIKDKELQQIEGEDFYNKVTFNSFINLYDSILDDSLGEELKNDLNKIGNDLKKIYDFIKKIYLYCYVKVSIKSKDFPKDIKREMLIPVRHTVYEFMIAALATLNTLGYHLVCLERRIDGNRYCFRTPGDDDGFSAIDNYFTKILWMKKIDLWYDFGEDWLFEISFKKLEYHNEFLPLKILKFKGSGIIEDNKNLLYEIVEKKDSEIVDEEYAAYIEDFYGDDLESINDRSLMEYDNLLESYMHTERF